MKVETVAVIALKEASPQRRSAAAQEGVQNLALPRGHAAAIGLEIGRGVLAQEIVETESFLGRLLNLIPAGQGWELEGHGLEVAHEVV